MASHVGTVLGPDLLWIERVVDNHTVIVRATGEVDLVTAPMLAT
jgi:hypothetical protein